MVFKRQQKIGSNRQRSLETRPIDFAAQSRRDFAVAIVVACLTITVVGCQTDDREAVQPAATSSDTSTPDASSVDARQDELAAPNPSDSIAERESDRADQDAGGVALKPVDRTGLDELIQGQKGKVVLIDFWATWCVPCVKGLPHTVELSKKYDDDDLLVVTLAMESEEQSAAVKATLDSVDATGTHNLIAHLDAFKAMDVFEISSGTLPTLRLYSRAGELVQTFGDGDPEPIDFQAIEVAIRGEL